LQFDRLEGNVSAQASILYADITSPAFAQFHQTLIKTARTGKTSYRVRHKRPDLYQSKPLVIGGYGVELALKRTDYIVIDDREADEEKSEEEQVKAEINLDDEEFADLKPLSTSEVLSLGLKASSLIMQSENPLQMLARISQDFPRYSSAIAAHNISSEFVAEHTSNRAQLVPAGMNVFWLNGLEIPERQIDAFSLLDIIRRERRLLSEFREVGLTGKDTIDLLSHEAVAATKVEDEPVRFDWRDTIEGGDIIVWLNDVEKDKRYLDWPTDITNVRIGPRMPIIDLEVLII
jgi:UDP-glucose:glycoprotein glucosyltransferase